MNINFGALSALVIDDFQNMRATLRQMLVTIGMNEVDAAARPEEALEKLGERRYDIVLCDYNLGDGMDGQQLLEAAREQGSVGPATAFMMVTAENSSEMVMGALEAMPDAYLTKPFTKDLLRARLTRILPRKIVLLPVDTALRKKDIRGAVTAIDQLLAEGPANVTDLLRMKADLCLRLGDLDVTESVCRQVLAEKPAAWASTLLGQCELRRGRIDEAEQAFRDAIESMPVYMPAHDGLAATMERRNRNEEALSILQAAVERSPKSLQRQVNLARLAESLGKFDTTERALRRAIEIGRQTGRERPEWHVSLLGALTAKNETRLAQTIFKNLAARFPGRTDMAWWIVAAKLALLARNASSSDKAAVLSELTALTTSGKPPRDAAAYLALRLRVIGEDGHADMMIELAN